MNDAVIEASGVSKRYGDVVALDRVDVTVRPGEIYALLGLNGAGKTTLIRLLLGMVRPSGGAVSLFTHHIPTAGPAVWSRVGYLVEGPAAYPDLTVRENLTLVRRLRQLPDDTRVDDAIARLRLDQYADRRAGTLSLGNAQRLGLAKALIHQPDLVILDEPANGLDPAGVVEIRDLLHELAATGTTVFLSSHVLAEVERLATRIGIIHAGRMVRELDAADLAHEVRTWLRVATRDDTAATRTLTAAGLIVDESHPDGLRLTDPGAVTRPDDIATMLVNAGHPPTALAVEREDLETYFLRTVGMIGKEA
jgi:ABC-2 type transport system ATP-binding protein